MGAHVALACAQTLSDNDWFQRCVCYAPVMSMFVDAPLAKALYSEPTAGMQEKCFSYMVQGDLLSDGYPILPSARPWGKCMLLPRQYSVGLVLNHAASNFIQGGNV